MPRELERHFNHHASRWIVYVTLEAGNEGLRHFIEQAIARGKNVPDTVLVASDAEARLTAPIRGIFDEVVTGAEFDFLHENEVIEALRAKDADDRAVGASFSPDSQIMTFITGDVKRVAVPASAVGTHPVMGVPDYAAIALTDGGHTVTFGPNYEVAFDGLRYAHDVDYRKVVRKRARDRDTSFGGCLRRARFHKGLNQGDLGVTDRTIRRIETGTDGERDINRRTRQLIERHLGMTFKEIKTF